MPTLVEKIEANAAARLPLPEGRAATQELARYNAFLKVETHRLKLLHRAVAADRDMRSKTSLIEWRIVVGDRKLCEKFENAVLARCVIGHEDEYILQRIEGQEARRAKFGNSSPMQEPNIKNGCGGLRDYQNLLWMAFFKYRTRSLKDLQNHELSSESERKQLEAAYDFILRARTEMHYHLNRATEVLGKNLQPAIA